MTRCRTSLISRALITAFALWLPAVTSQSSTGSCPASALVAMSKAIRPHLSCHEDHGQNGTKDCCCNNKPALRARACNCHDGDSAFAVAATDPMVASRHGFVFVRVFRPVRHAALCDVLHGRVQDAPDPRPPRIDRLASN